MMKEIIMLWKKKEKEFVYTNCMGLAMDKLQFACLRKSEDRLDSMQTSSSTCYYKCPNGRIGGVSIKTK